MGLVALALFAGAAGFSSASIRGTLRLNDLLGHKEGANLRCADLGAYLSLSDSIASPIYWHAPVPLSPDYHCLPPRSDHSPPGKKSGHPSPALCLLGRLSGIAAHCTEIAAMIDEDSDDY